MLLGDDVDKWLTGVQKPPTEPVEGSPWHRDGSALDAYSGWYLACGALSVGVAYLHTLRELLLRSGAVHPHPPLGLLRGAVEASGTALWLALPDEDVERQRRAVRAWYADRP